MCIYKFFGEYIEVKFIKDTEDKDSCYLEITFNEKTFFQIIIFLSLFLDKYGTSICLTKREEEILTHVANGENNTEISKILGISTHTVKMHLAHIFIKLNVFDRTQAVIEAARFGLIDISNIL